MAIRALMFDLGGVLEIVDDAVWPLSWTHDWARRFGLTIEAWEARMAAYDLTGAGTGGVTELDTKHAYQAGLGLSEAQTESMFSDLWNRYCGRLDADLIRYAEELASAYRLGIVSNSADGARREEEKRFGLSRLFNPIVYSHEVGVAKPDTGIFELATRQLGVKPRQVLFVDDVSANVDAARRYGWAAVLHTDTAGTLAALDEMLGRPARRRRQ